MKNKLIVCSVGHNTKIGSVFVGIIGLKPNFLRENYLNTKGEVDTKNLEHFYAIKIRQEDLKENVVEDAISRCLNTYPKFWEHNIYIKSNFDDEEQFKEKIINCFTRKLRNEKLKEDKWALKNKADTPAIRFAESIFNKYRKDELEYIEKLYGEIKTEEDFIRENPECPFIRKNDI